MDIRTGIKALLVQLVLVGVLAVILAIALPRSFFEDWGWLSGPVAWLGCAAATARIVGLPITGTMVGAVLVGLPALIAVVLGIHWLGTLIAVVLFALWCARLAVDRTLDAEIV
jgi:hypothetical protein